MRSTLQTFTNSIYYVGLWELISGGNICYNHTFDQAYCVKTVELHCNISLLDFGLTLRRVFSES